MTIVVLFSGFC